MTGAIGIGCLAAGLAVLLTMSGTGLADTGTPPTAPNCAAPPSLTAIDASLDRTAFRVQAGKAITIVAMGSSSTQGAGASLPANSYPSRLEQELRERFPDVAIRVVNHGIGGQDVPEELARLDHDVIAERPDLVIWQVGTNAVLRRDDLSADEQLIRRGVLSLQKNGIDVVLMDLQFAPRVVARPASAEMVRMIAEIAKGAHIAVFRRFEIMKEWDRTHQLAPAELIGSDGLHMTDASYRCLANQLAEALAWNWWSRAKLAKSPARSPNAMAGMQRSGSPAAPPQ